MTARPLPYYATVGAVLDRLALLDVKRELLRDEDHRRLAAAEKAELDAAWTLGGLPPPRGVRAYALLHSVHRRLWQLENAARTAERRRAFGPDFLCLFDDIQRLNADRAGHRRLVDTSLGDGTTTLVEVPAGLDTYADQIAIHHVRQRRRGTPASAGAEVLREVWLAHRLPDIFTGTVFRRLSLANDRLWAVKEELDLGLAGPGPSVDTCRSLYLVNDARCRAKNLIAVSLESPLRDVKEYVPYPMPAGWDAGTLSWRHI